MSTYSLRPSAFFKLTHTIIALVSLTFAITYGLNYGVSNQNSYFIHGLHLADPQFLQGDWLVTESTDHHPAFSLLVLGLVKSDLLVWGSAILNVLLIAISVSLLYWMVASVNGSTRSISAFLLLVGMMTVDRTVSVGHSYAFGRIFQPSTLATLGFITAIVFYVKKGYIRSGLCLAVGGLFHVNFLVLSFPVYFITHLFLGYKRLTIRLIQQLGPPSISLLIFLPMLLSSVKDEKSAQARAIIQTIRSPHHYLPSSFMIEFVWFFFWLAIAVFSILYLRRSCLRNQPLVPIWFTIATVVCTATALTTIVHAPIFAQLYFWRLAPYAIVLSQLLVSVAVVRFIEQQSRPIRLDYWIFGSIATGLLALTLSRSLFFQSGRRASYFLVVIAIACIIRLFCRTKTIGKILRQPTLLLLPTASAFLLLISMAFLGLYRNSTLIIGLPPAEEDLYSWAATTPRDSVYLIPPLLENFRLNAGRAVVTDWKTNPYSPKDTIEWYRRLGKICGDPNIIDKHGAEEGYAGMDTNRLNELVQEFDVDYAIFRKQRPTATEWSSIVYQNDEYFVVSTKTYAIH